MTIEQKLQKMVNDLRKYTLKTRAIGEVSGDPYGCVYYNPETKNKCIIGKQIPHDILMDIEEYWADTSIVELLICVPDIAELDTFKEVSSQTLDDLQRIHDMNNFYNEMGLTEEGVEQLNITIQNINKDYGVNVK